MSEEYNGFIIASTMGTMKHIKAKGKGSVVKRLRGLFTSTREARKAIDAYLVDKGKGNGKAKSTD
jgi:hypothetical protein